MYFVPDLNRLILRPAGSSRAGRNMKMTLTAAFFLLLLANSTNLFAEGWLLMTPDFKVTETEITPTKKWVMLESFATVVECNDHRSSMIRQIDKQRREIKAMEDHGGTTATDRELRLLWFVYTSSKCVLSP